MKRLLIFIFSFLFLKAQAQHSFEYSLYTQDDGLASAVINSISKDSAGYIWLISEVGLMRFDGYNFKTFRHISSDSTTIPSSYIQSLLVDSHGEILVRTDNSFCKYIPSTGSFKNLYAISTEISIGNCFNGKNYCWAIKKNALLQFDVPHEKVLEYKFPRFINNGSFYGCEFGSNVILLNNHSLLKFDFKKQTFKSTNIQIKGGVISLFEHRKNLYCYSTNGLYKYNQQADSFALLFPSNICKTIKSSVKSIQFAEPDFLVIGFSKSQILGINITTGDERLYALPDKNALVDMVHVYPCSIGGKIWANTISGNFYNIDLKKGKISTHEFLSKKFDLPLATTNIDYLYDDGNILWIASPGNGLVKAELYNNSFFSFRPYNANEADRDEWSNNIRTIADWDENNLIVGTIHGVFLFNKKEKKFLAVPYDFKAVGGNNTNAFGKILCYKDYIFISSWYGDAIFIINKNTKRLSKVSFKKMFPNAKISVRSLFIDSRSIIWIGSSNNLVLRIPLDDLIAEKESAFEKFGGKNSSIDFGVVFAFEETTTGEILIASEKGFYTYTSSTNHFIKFVNDTKNASSISENNVRCIYINGNTAWLGTNGGGLNSFDLKTKRFNHYTTTNGLSENYVYSILPDEKQNLWLGTSKGICCFNIQTKKCLNYTLKDGIQNFEFNTNAALKSRDGNFVMGGINGISIFNPTNFQSEESTPNVVVTDFLVNGNKKAISSSTVIDLKSDEHNLSISFAALSFFKNHENKYAYKLEGMEGGWNYCGTNRQVFFSNLQSGKYTFRVKASDCYGNWNESGTSISFIIATPWWRTWWFYFLIIIAVALLSYSFYRYRLNQTIKLQNIRDNIARDLHDEIGSNLSSISLFSEVAKENVHQNNFGSVLPVIQKIEDYTQVSQEAMSDIVWMINSRNDSFENISTRMRSFASEVLETNNIHVQIEIDKELEYQKLSMVQRKNFYLIFKEAVNNISKYSQCKNVFIKINFVNSKITMLIEDNGIGFDINAITKGNGLQNMKNRAKELNGKIIFDSKINAGTKINLAFAP